MEFSEKIMGKLGGSALLKKKYPELYKVFLHSGDDCAGRKMHACMARPADAYIYGTQDSYKIRTLNYDPATTLETSSGIDTDDVQPSLAIIGTIKDLETGRDIDGFSVMGNNTDHLFGESVTQASALAGGETKKFQAESSFYVIKNDETGKPYAVTVSNVMDAEKLYKNMTMVANLTVSAPMPVNHTGADRTTVYYNRGGAGADYAYQNVKMGDDNVDIHMPFSGEAELNAIVTPDPQEPIILTGDKAPVLQIENIHNGCASFNPANLKDIEVTVSGQKISWKFPDQWDAILNKNKLNHANDLNFYCRMYIKTTIGILVPIVIQSEGEQHQDPSYQKIPYINILWGCLERDAMIKMADGTSKPVYQVKEGDEVLSRDGSAHKVKGVMEGMESELIYIETSAGDRIRVTKDHPLLTAEGMIMADMLTAGSILVTEHGNVSIEALYVVGYNDKAYNLQFDGEVTFVANGFYVGDAAAQNKADEAKKNAPKKLEAYQEEFAELCRDMDRMMKEKYK